MFLSHTGLNNERIKRSESNNSLFISAKAETIKVLTKAPTYIAILPHCRHTVADIVNQITEIYDHDQDDHVDQTERQLTATWILREASH